MARLRMQRLNLIAALIALMVALFAVTPLAEAAVCSSETVAATAAADGAPADTSSQGDDDCCLPSGGCVHGHCHASGSLPAHPAEVTRHVAPAVRGMTLTVRTPDSTRPDGLIRPPRA